MNNENKVREKDLSVHDWYRFVLSFPPHLVQEYIEKFSISKSDIVLDPFCGTGTTNVECKKNGIASIGIDASPIACFACSTKCSWQNVNEQMYNEAILIADRAKSIINGCKNPRHLSEEQDKLILKGSISEEPLHQVLILRDTIRSAHSVYEEYFLLALAKHIVFSYSNLKFGPEVGIRRKKIYSADVVGIWLSQVKIIQNDLEQYSALSNVSSQIINGDARTISPFTITKKVNFIMTSPPYPNEKDYSRTTRLESVLLGYIRNKEDLRNIKKNFIRSNTKNVYKDDDDFRFVENIASISSLILELSKKFFDSLIVRCKQFFRCSFFHDHAIFHKYDMICHIFCEIHLVGYDDHRHMFCRQIFDDL